MIAALAVGVVLGGIAAVAVMRFVRLRAERATMAHLDEVVPAGIDDSARPDSDALARIRRVADELTDSAAHAELATTRLERALDHMADGIVVCDEEGRVVFTNDAGAVLADARHEDALVAAAVTDCLRAAVAGRPESRSVELFGPPSRTITVDAQPLGGSGTPLGAVATIADESRVRRLESVRSDFVANVSHELKTPIGGLALLAEALSEAGESGEQERLAGRLLHEAHRVGRVVDDLLVLSEVEGEVVRRRESVAVAEIVERALIEVEILLSGFGIDVDTSGVHDDLWVIGDLVQLTSAVTNLVENAVKYSGGASPVTVRAHADGRSVRVVVADRGIGIPRADLDRVFERFYRVDQARSRATGGTGLGLAIVRNVVQRHGGEVELTSREGEGTTVTVILPRAGAADGGDAPAGLVAPVGADGD